MSVKPIIAFIRVVSKDQNTDPQNNLLFLSHINKQDLRSSFYLDFTTCKLVCFFFYSTKMQAKKRKNGKKLIEQFPYLKDKISDILGKFPPEIFRSRINRVD